MITTIFRLIAHVLLTLTWTSVSKMWPYICIKGASLIFHWTDVWTWLRQKINYQYASQTFADYNITSDGWIQWRGNQYYINTNSMYMEDARHFCQQRHGDLASINSKEENVFIWKQVGIFTLTFNYGRYWKTFYQIKKEGLRAQSVYFSVCVCVHRFPDTMGPIIWVCLSILMGHFGKCQWLE